MIRPVFLASFLFFIAVSTVLKNAVKLSKICASLQFLCLHLQILSAKRFVVSSWLAWLWLWCINIGYTKLGWFLPKMWPSQRFVLDILKWKWLKWLKMDFPGQFTVSKIDFSEKWFYYKDFFGFREQLLVLKFFDTFNFWTPLFCKNGPSFCLLGIPPFQKTSEFSLILVIYLAKFFAILMFNIQSHATLGLGIHFQFSLYSASIFDERATIFVQKAMRFM